MSEAPGSGTRLLPCFAIVQGGRPDVFRTLKTDLEEPGVIEVIWDRRRSDRRRTSAEHGPERRRAERRGQPPEMWASFGFLVAPQRPWNTTSEDS